VVVLMLTPAGSDREPTGPRPAIPVDLDRLPTPCGRCVVASRPGSASLSWLNVTPEALGDVPPASTGASLALDTATDQLVWFGGCDGPLCVGNQTWTFSGGAWTNITATSVGPPPPARTEAAMLSAGTGSTTPVPVLFGGVSAAGGLLNDTWVLGSSGWNRATPACATGCPPPLAETGIADGGFYAGNVTVVFGGCRDANCSELSNATWKFYWNASNETAWAGGGTASSPSPRANPAMGFDPALQAIVLFGGRTQCGAAPCAASDVWTFSRNSWTNVTTTVGGTAPPSRSGGALVWDAQLGGLLLTGGQNGPDGPAANSTYLLNCSSTNVSSCEWTRPLPGPSPGLVGSAIATDPGPIAPGPFGPVSVGGTSASDVPENATWVFGALPSLNVAVAPAPQVVDRPVYLNATAVGSTDPTFVFLWGDGTVDRSATGDGVHQYTREGPENASVYLLEPNGTANQHRLVLDVEGTPNGTISAAIDPVDVGVADLLQFTPNFGTGIPPFVVNWSFPGGSQSDAVTIDPAFPTPGSATVTVTVTDSSGRVGSVSKTLEVDPAPLVRVSGEFVSNGTAVADATTPTVFRVNVTQGTPPYNVKWSFGAGADEYGATAVHTYPTGPGAETVTATVRDAGGADLNDSLPVRVFAALAITSVDVTPPSVRPGANVSFREASSGGDGVSTVAWTFGDGGGATGASSVEHSYGTPGTYTVTAWVNDSAGSLTSSAVVVTVSPPSTFAGWSDPWVWVGVGVVVVVAVGALVWVRRRKPAVSEAGTNEAP
jgi:PKD repeat protein